MNLKHFDVHGSCCPELGHWLASCSHWQPVAEHVHVAVVMPAASLGPHTATKCIPSNQPEPCDEQYPLDTWGKLRSASCFRRAQFTGMKDVNELACHLPKLASNRS